jgi:hypothetical protein
LNAAIRAVSPMPEGSLRDCSQEVVDACRARLLAAMPGTSRSPRESPAAPMS